MEEPFEIRHLFYTQQKRNRTNERLAFLQRCKEEQVLPKSAPNQLRSKKHPFTPAARAFLEDGIKDLKDESVILMNRSTNGVLPDYLKNRLKIESAEHRASLHRKLDRLCESSDWNRAGNNSLITNLSHRVLTETERAALSLGLKFDIGEPNKHLKDFIIKNHRYDDSDLEKGFKQGVTACMTAAAKDQDPTIPKRFVKALEGLREDPSIIITTADKGGGVVVMRTEEYQQKMESLLQDRNTYKSVRQGTCNDSSGTFTKQARKLLRHSESGKKLQNLLEEKPTAPSMRGQPKTHKDGVPMRPITSGIGSAPHRLAKRLAKPLTRCLGVMSPTHLKNSADLLEKLKSVDVTDKKMVSLDVKSLFTNVSVDGAMQALKEVLDLVEDIELPVPKDDYIKLVELCVNFGNFEFQGDEYVQINGLAMGSPLSAVLANLYMELLEKDHYLGILGETANVYRYVDDILAFIPKESDVNDILRRLNEVEPAIQLTVEEERDGTLPFLDVIIRRSSHDLKYSVYRKPTNKDDFVHYFSAHGHKTKTGIVIGFYLRAYRICSPEFLDDELKYVTNAFSALRFPKALLIILQEKARKIKERADRRRREETAEDLEERADRRQEDTAEETKEKDRKTILVIPHSQHVDKISKQMAPQVRLVSASGKKIGQVVKKKKTKKENADSTVYKIPCGKCEKSYFGETGRGLRTRIREHRNDLKNYRTTKAIVMHADKEGHLPKWNEATALHSNLTKKERWLIEAAYIQTEKVLNVSPGFLKLHTSVAEIIKAEAKASK